MFSRLGSVSNYANTNFDIVNIEYNRLSTTSMNILEYKKKIPINIIIPEYVKFISRSRELVYNILYKYPMKKIAIIFFNSYHFTETELNDIKNTNIKMYYNIRKLQILCLYYKLSLDKVKSKEHLKEIFWQGKIRPCDLNYEELAFNEINFHFDIDAIATDNIYRDLFFSTIINLQCASSVIFKLNIAKINFNDVVHCFSGNDIVNIITNIKSHEKINFVLEHATDLQHTFQYNSLPITLNETSSFKNIVISTDLIYDSNVAHLCMTLLQKSEDNDKFMVEIINKTVESYFINRGTMKIVEDFLFCKISNVIKSVDMFTDFAKLSIMVVGYKILDKNIVPYYLANFLLNYLLNPTCYMSHRVYSITRIIISDPYVTFDIDYHLIRKYIKFYAYNYSPAYSLCANETIYYLLANCTKELTTANILEPIKHIKLKRTFDTTGFAEVLLAHLPLDKVLINTLNKMMFNISEPERFDKII